jgi:hypothetical protein
MNPSVFLIDSERDSLEYCNIDWFLNITNKGYNDLMLLTTRDYCYIGNSGNREFFPSMIALF